MTKTSIFLIAPFFDMKYESLGRCLKYKTRSFYSRDIFPQLWSCVAGSGKFWSTGLNMSRQYCPKHLRTREQFLSFFMLSSPHHSGTGWSLGVHRMLSRDCKGLVFTFRRFLANSTVGFLLLRLAPLIWLMKSSLDCWLCLMASYLLERLLGLGQQLWRGFPSLRKEFFCCLPQVFSLVFQVFWWPEHSFFLRTFQGIDLAISLVRFNFSDWWWLASPIVTALWITRSTDSKHKCHIWNQLQDLLDDDETRE